MNLVNRYLNKFIYARDIKTGDELIVTKKLRHASDRIHVGDTLVVLSACKCRSTLTSHYSECLECPCDNILISMASFTGVRELSCYVKLKTIDGRKVL